MSAQHGLTHIVVAVLTGSASLLAQFPPVTVWVPVTYYDYKADESNPNFQPDTLCQSAYDKLAAPGIRAGMVLANLSSDLKPLLQAASVHPFHSNLDNWFRPSGIAGTGAAFTTPHNGPSSWSNLVPGPGTGEWIGANYRDSDSMANIVIYDSLLFTLTSASLALYEFSSDSFFPLDSRGYGVQPTTSVCAGHDPASARHNYGFAMELHRVFCYVPGTVVEFAGDDDMWVFIDSRLVADMGGIHGQTQVRLNLDTMLSFAHSRHSLDLFKCERSVTESKMHISTNLGVDCHTCTPLSVSIDPRPRDTVELGDSLILTAIVDIDGYHPYWSSELSLDWRVVPDDGGLEVSNRSATELVLRPLRPSGEYTVVADLGPDTVCQPDRLHDTVTVTVVPGPARRYHFEPAATCVPWSLNCWLDTLVLGVYAVTSDSFYLVARDGYQSPVGYVDAVTWESSDTAVVRAGNGPHPELGQGQVTRVRLGGGRARVIANCYPGTDSAFSVSLPLKVLRGSPDLSVAPSPAQQSAAQTGSLLLECLGLSQAQARTVLRVSIVDLRGRSRQVSVEQAIHMLRGSATPGAAFLRVHLSDGTAVVRRVAVR